MAFQGQRELIMGAPALNLDTVDTAESTTLQASEPGIIDLDRLVVAGTNEASNAQGQDFSRQLWLTSILVQNSIELIRARNSPNAPAGVFAGYRGLSGMPLGKWPLQTGDTIKFTYVARNTGVDGNVYTSAPFLPRSSRGASPALPNWSPVFASSPIAAAGAGISGNTATITFDEDGIMDLTSLQIQAGMTKTGTITPSYDGNPAVGITNITLPNSNNVVIGDSTPVVSGANFAAGYRQFTWVAFGAYPVSAGSTLVVTYNNLLAEAMEMSAAVRFYPQGGPANRGQRSC